MPKNITAATVAAICRRCFCCSCRRNFCRRTYFSKKNNKSVHDIYCFFKSWLIFSRRQYKWQPSDFNQNPLKIFFSRFFFSSNSMFFFSQYVFILSLLQIVHPATNEYVILALLQGHLAPMVKVRNNWIVEFICSLFLVSIEFWRYFAFVIWSSAILMNCAELATIWK